MAEDDVELVPIAMTDADDRRSPNQLLWATVRNALPSPTWTVVLVERVEQATIDGRPLIGKYISRWWAYAEPGLIDEPDPARRLELRLNAEGTDDLHTLLLLRNLIERTYPAG